jgi:hypothetical protein
VGVTMTKFVQGVQPSVQPYVQGKLRAVIALCKVCNGLACAYARMIEKLIYAHAGYVRVIRARTPAHLARAASGGRFTPAHTLTHTLAHLAQR